jgi:hypothetical protein
MGRIQEFDMQITICGDRENWLDKMQVVLYGHTAMMADQVHWLRTQAIEKSHEVARANNQQEGVGEFGRDKKRL